MVKESGTIRKQTLSDNTSNVVKKPRALGTTNMWRSREKLRRKPMN
jgi:hypothetical protein